MKNGGKKIYNKQGIIIDIYDYIERMKNKGKQRILDIYLFI